MRFVDLTGSRFARLFVLGVSHKSKGGMYYYNCLCDCGTEKAIARSSLQRGLSTSCGCYAQECRIKNNTTHGMSKTAMYGVWNEMVNRATNPDHKHYEYYMGRGIGICDEWLIFENFYRDMGERPGNAWIERVDNNKGYCKENCKWGSISQQGSNQRSLNNTSGRIGVWWDESSNKWRASLRVNKQRIDCGRFDSFDAACLAIEAAELKHLGYSRAEGFLG